MRRGRAKAARNERRKALATTFNALAIAVVVGTIVLPVLSHHLQLLTTFAGVVLFVVFQSALHYVLDRLED